MIAENKNNSHRSYSFGDQEEVKAIDGPRKYEFPSWLAWVWQFGTVFNWNCDMPLAPKAFHPITL